MRMLNRSHGDIATRRRRLGGGLACQWLQIHTEWWRISCTRSIVTLCVVSVVHAKEHASGIPPPGTIESDHLISADGPAIHPGKWELERLHGIETCGCRLPQQEVLERVTRRVHIGLVDDHRVQSAAAQLAILYVALTPLPGEKWVRELRQRPYGGNSPRPGISPHRSP